MRTQALAGAVACLCTLASLATGQSPSITEQMIPAKDRMHNFGSVARAAKTEHRFEIRNPFSQPLHLRSVSTSCGCTTPHIETEWIQPGEVGYVIARFNTATFSGDRKATLNLSIDQPSFMQLQLNVQGYIRTDIVINPGELNFGNVPEGQSKEIEADIEYAGRGDWKITEVTSSSDLVTASIEEVARSVGRVAYKIKARLSPTQQLGLQSTMLTLQTNDNRLKSVPLACLADIQAPLSVHPTSLSLGDMKRGQSAQHRLLVKGNEPFRILDVRLPEMDIQFEAATEAKAIQFVNVTIVPKSDMPIGRGKSILSIKTDLGDERELAMDISFNILEDTAPAAAAFTTKVSSRQLYRCR